jgi:hypothetical protein
VRNYAEHGSGESSQLSGPASFERNWLTTSQLLVARRKGDHHSWAVNTGPARLFILLFALLWGPGRANANVTVLLEEPYSYDGAFAGLGHVAVYLDRVCADSFTSLRSCAGGEHGVVISRYNRIGGYDWIAVPLIPYLYAVTDLEDVPFRVDGEMVAILRDRYRREHLQAIAPDDPSGQAPGGNWVQLVGSAYNRTSFAYEMGTSSQQDDELIAWLNSRPNRPRYRALSHNCADFARDIVNFYYPKAVSRSIADFGITTPKRVARSIAKYSRRHPDLDFVSRVIPQVPGSIRRSRPVRGMAESVFKAKKYVIPLAVFQPYVAGVFVAAYLVDGRFSPDRRAALFQLDTTVESSLTGSGRRIPRDRLAELAHSLSAPLEVKWMLVMWE